MKATICICVSQSAIFSVKTHQNEHVRNAFLTTAFTRIKTLISNDFWHHCGNPQSMHCAKKPR
ncbi:MAG TPA: hypothetical protein VIL31_09275, partial [Cyclobacteriaceae bacterium]